MLIPLYLEDVTEKIEAGLDYLEIQRYVDNSFRPLTSDAATAATIVGENEGRYELEGTEFIIEVSGIWYTLPFTDPNPYTLSDVLTELNTLANITAVEDDGKVSVSTVATGKEVYLRIGEGSANTTLGFTVNDVSYGTEAHITLVDTTTYYFFLDLDGDTDSAYRYRFVGTNKYTDWEEITAEAEWLVDSERVCLCYVKLLDIEGSPLSDIIVGVSHVHSSSSVQAASSVYTVGSYAEVETDSEGYAHLFLTRNATVDVIIESTGLVRRVTIPDDTVADLLDESLAESDLFEIQYLDVPDAIRRS